MADSLSVLLVYDQEDTFHALEQILLSQGIRTEHADKGPSNSQRDRRKSALPMLPMLAGREGCTSAHSAWHGKALGRLSRKLLSPAQAESRESLSVDRRPPSPVAFLGAEGEWVSGFMSLKGTALLVQLP